MGISLYNSQPTNDQSGNQSTEVQTGVVNGVGGQNLGGSATQNAAIQTSQSTLGEGISAIDQQPYTEQVIAAQEAGAQRYAAGNAALGVQGPTINNAGGAASRQQLAGVQAGYQKADQGLAQTMGGGGPNAGAATEQQGLNSSIAAQMAAAHSGTGGQGGYSQAGAAAGQNAGAAANSALASQAAQARGAQIGQAQSQAGQNYSAQGGLALQQGGIQQQAALAQAQLAQRQQGMDTGQAQALYGQSAQEQQMGLAATNAYLQQQQAAQQASIAAQNAANAKSSSIWSDITTGIGDVAKVAAVV